MYSSQRTGSYENYKPEPEIAIDPKSIEMAKHVHGPLTNEDVMKMSQDDLCVLKKLLEKRQSMGRDTLKDAHESSDAYGIDPNEDLGVIDSRKILAEIDAKLRLVNDRYSSLLRAEEKTAHKEALMDWVEGRSESLDVEKLDLKDLSFLSSELTSFLLSSGCPLTQLKDAFPEDYAKLELVQASIDKIVNKPYKGEVKD